MKKLNLVFVVVGILMMVIATSCTPPNPAGPGAEQTAVSVHETETAVALAIGATEVATATNGTATEVATSPSGDTATATMTSTAVVVLPSPTATETSTPEMSTIVIEITGDVDGLFNVKYGTNNGNGIVLFYDNAKPATAATAFSPGTKTWISLPITQVVGTSYTYYSGDAMPGQILTVVLKRTVNGETTDWHTEKTTSATIVHFGGTIGQ